MEVKGAVVLPTWNYMRGRQAAEKCIDKGSTKELKRLLDYATVKAVECRVKNYRDEYYEGFRDRLIQHLGRQPCQNM